MNRRQSSVIEAWKKLEIKLREGAKVEQVQILDSFFTTLEISWFISVL